MLPKMTSALCTLEWLKAVKEKKLWCPYWSEMQFRECASPPTMTVIMEELDQLLQLQGKRIQLDPQKPKWPDQEWALRAISALNPDHEFFHKKYRPPAKLKKEKEGMVDNSDGFFDDLPNMNKSRRSTVFKNESVKHLNVRLQNLPQKFEPKRQQMEKYLTLSFKMKYGQLGDGKKKKSRPGAQRSHEVEVPIAAVVGGKAGDPPQQYEGNPPAGIQQPPAFSEQQQFVQQ